MDNRKKTKTRKKYTRKNRNKYKYTTRKTRTKRVNYNRKYTTKTKRLARKSIRGGHKLDSVIDGRILKDMIAMINGTDTTKFKLFLLALNLGMESISQGGGSGYSPIYIGTDSSLVDSINIKILELEDGAVIPEEYKNRVMFVTGSSDPSTLDNDILIKKCSEFLDTQSEITAATTYNGKLGSCSLIAMIYVAYLNITYTLQSLLPLISIYDNPFMHDPEHFSMDYSSVQEKLQLSTKKITDGSVITIFCGVDHGSGSHYFLLTLSKDKSFIYSKFSRNGDLFDDEGLLGHKQVEGTTDKLLTFIKTIFNGKNTVTEDDSKYYEDLVRGHETYYRKLEGETIAIYEFVN